VVIGIAIWVRQWLLGAWSAVNRHNHVLTSRVVGTANRDGFAKLVLDIDTTMTLHTEALVLSAGLVKLSVLAKKTSVGFATRGLDIWPLGFAITGWTGIRAKTSVNTLITGTTVDLNSGVTTIVQPRNGERAIGIWEGITVNNSVWELALWITIGLREVGGWSLDWCFGG